MPIQRIPSKWDYLAEGVSGFSRGRDDRRKRALENFHIINQLYQSGGATAEQLQQAGIATGIPELGAINPLPTQAERREQILSRPPLADIDMSIPGGMTTPSALPTGGGFAPMNVSGLPQRGAAPVARPAGPKPRDIEYEAAGLTSPTEQAIRATELATKKLQLAEIPKDIAAKRQKEADAHFKDAARRFVRGEVPDVSQIDARMRDQVIDSAFAKYKAMRQSSAMGQIPDEAYARGFFNEAFSDAISEKLENDIKIKMALGRQLTRDERLFADLTQRLNNNRQYMADMQKADPLLSFKIGKAEYANDPSVKEWNNLQDINKRLIEAQNKIADPRIRGTIGPTPEGPPAEVKPTVGPVGTSFVDRVNTIVSKATTELKTKSIEKVIKDINDAVGVEGGLTQDEAKAAIAKLRGMKFQSNWANPEGKVDTGYEAAKAKAAKERAERDKREAERRSKPETYLPVKRPST